jgi:uncharacterized protein YjbJ (UPF0337 family)
MNRDQVQGRWRQLKGRAKKWWGRTTGDDLLQVFGELERLIGVFQQQYGDQKVTRNRWTTDEERPQECVNAIYRGPALHR